MIWPHCPESVTVSCFDISGTELQFFPDNGLAWVSEIE